MIFGDHLEGFEKERRYMDLFRQVSETGVLYYMKEFKRVVEILNPELGEGAYTRRPCRRQLRYIGEGDDFFTPGEIYHSIDFNGGTYSIEGYARLRGCAYFEWIKDESIH